MQTNAQRQVLPSEQVPQVGETTIFLRLDEPANGSSRVASQLKIRGWFRLPEGVSLDENEPKIGAFLEELHPGATFAREVVLLSGRELKVGSDAAGAFLESLEILPTSEKIFDNEFALSGRAHLVEGILDVSRLARGPGCLYSLSLRLSVGDYSAVSNPNTFALLDEADAEQAKGGFLAPVVADQYSDFLVVDAWALAPGEELREVEIFAGELSLGMAVLDLESLDVERLLPDYEKSRFSRFSRTIHWQDGSRRGLPEQSVREFLLSAHCVFRSGRELRLPGPRVRWRPAEVLGDLRKQVAGEVEAIERTEDGYIRLRGWSLSLQDEFPQFQLRSLRRSFSVDPLVQPQVRFSRFRREDIEERLSIFSQRRDYGFSIEFDPLIFGRFPGRIQLLALSPRSESQTVLTREFQELQLAEMLEEGSAYETTRERGIARYQRTLARFKIGRAENIPAENPRRAQGSVPERLLLVSHNLSAVEGAPKVLFRLAKYIRENAPDVEVRLVSGFDGALRESFEQIGVSVETIVEAQLYGHYRERYLRACERLNEILREFQPDVVYGNVVDSFWGVDVAYRAEIPALLCIHESVDPRLLYNHLPVSFRQQFLHRLFHIERLVFVSEKTRQLFQPFQKVGSSIVIPNGLDLKEIERSKQQLSRESARRELGLAEEFVVSVVGTTTRRKGQDIFVREMALLKERRADMKFRFFVVGAREMDFLNELRDQTRELGLDADLCFVPETPDVVPFYRASDVMVVSSREESAPLVSLEAFAYEVPLVSTTVFGLSEQIRDEENALAFDSAEIGSLASKVERLIDEPFLRERLVKEATRDLTERFSAERSYAQHWKEICRVASR